MTTSISRSVGEFVIELMARRYWEGALMRVRVHFLGFVDEEEYVASEIPKVPDFIANPNLF